MDEELSKFVRDHIDSTWALELLLLLNSNVKRHWTEDQIVSEMHATAPLVSKILGQFQHRGFVERHGGKWVYSAKQCHPLIQSLAVMYRERPHATVRLIFNNDPIQSFADAFKFKGSDK